MWMEGVRRLGSHNHPQITLTGVSMHHSLAAWERGDLQFVRNVLVKDMASLAAAGADFFVLPDNTAHIALETTGEDFPLPGLHIAEVVADQAVRDGRRRIGILGTEWTMTGPVYRGSFTRRDLEFEIPNENDRQTIHRIIFDELCLGIFRDESRAEYVRIIEELAARGLRCGGSGLYGDPVADHAGRFPAADARLHAVTGGRRGRSGVGRAPDAGVARRAREVMRVSSYSLGATDAELRRLDPSRLPRRRPCRRCLPPRRHRSRARP